MNKKVLGILLMLSFLLSGCWGVNESERMLYIYGVGVDYKDGKYEIYAQIIDFANIAKSEQPNNPEAIQAEVGHASGETISKAFFELYKSMDQKLYWGHFAYIVFSEEVLKEGRTNSIINTFIRFYETRYNTWVYSTKDSVEDIMLTTPIINKAISMSKLADPLNSYKQDSLIAPVNLRKLILHLNEPSHEVKIPTISLKENWKTIKGSSEVTEINGVSIVTPNDLKGFISGDNVQGLQWMTNETIRAGVVIESASKMSVVLQNIDVTVKPIVHDGNDVKFDIEVQMVATLNGFQENVTPDEIKEEVEKKVAKEIRKTYEESLKIGADVYRLSEYLYRDNVKAWKKVQKDGELELTDNSIRNINVDIVKVTTGRKSFKETIE